MMSVICLHHRDDIQEFCRKNPYLHLYGLGDLDDLFWPQTQWYGYYHGTKLKAICQLYFGFHPPICLALSNPSNQDSLLKLINKILPQLPPTLYGHLSTGIETAFLPSHTLIHHGEHCKMALKDHELIALVDTTGVDRLTPADERTMLDLYSISYPDHAFDPQMVAYGPYFGIKVNGKLVSVAGIHTYSKQYRVAALGNITTHPAYRNQGLALKVTAKCCRELIKTTDHIGLNVKTDNQAAIYCYQKLGFITVATYHEWSIRLRTNVD